MNPFTTRRTVVTMALAGMTTVGGTVFALHADAGYGMVEATTAVNVRTGPSTKYRRIGVLYPGMSVQKLGASGSWTKVRYKNQNAWVHSNYIRTKGNSSAVGSSQPSGGKTAYTTANLNVRTGPGLGYPVVEVARKGTRLSLSGRTASGYSQITWKGSLRWVATAYLSQAVGAPAASLPPVVGKGRATAVLDIRTSSAWRYTAVGEIPKGTIMDLTGVTENGATQIIWAGTVRWVNKNYVRPVDETSGTKPNPAPTTSGFRYTTANLNIRVSYIHSSKIVGVAPRGTKLAITGVVKNQRAEVIYEGAKRWAAIEYLSTELPSGIPAGSGDIGLNHGWSKGLDKVNPDATRIVKHVWATWPEIKTMYGWRPGGGDHTAGRAIDVMLPYYKNNRALGWKIANYYKANYKKFNIKYIIFAQQIWNIERDNEGWRLMADRGGDTSNHYDHVHINTW